MGGGAAEVEVKEAAPSAAGIEDAQVVAYLLKLNGQPAGSAELPSDSLVLKTIRFEAAEKVRKRP